MQNPNNAGYFHGVVWWYGQSKVILFGLLYIRLVCICERPDNAGVVTASDCAALGLVAIDVSLVAVELLHLGTCTTR